jgi:dGTPase
VEERPTAVHPEGWVCRYADRIAYLAHDVQDAIRAGVLTPDDVPERFREVRSPGRAWIDSMVTIVVSTPRSTPVRSRWSRRTSGRCTTCGPGCSTTSTSARRRSRSRERGVRVIQDLVEWFADRPDESPTPTGCRTAAALQAAVDYVAGMSDKFAMRLHDERFRPAGLY